MNRLVSFFLAFLLPVLAMGKDEATYPQVERAFRPSKTSVVTDLDKAFVRGLIAAPGISTAQNAAAPNIVAIGDSFVAATGGQTPWLTQLRFNFRRGEFTNRGVGGETSTQIKARFDVLPVSDYQSKFFIFEMGRNDFGDSGVGAKANIDGCIATLSANGNNRWLVLGISNADGEGIGTANYTKCIAANTLFSASYGSRFVNFRPLLIAAYNPALPQDVIDHANDITPTSLRVVGDGLHPNTAGYKIISDAVYTTYTANYPIDDSAVTMANIEALFANPFDRQVPYWMTSANPIRAVSNTGARISTNGSIATTQNGDGFQIHGIFYGDGQNTLGGSASNFWWDSAFFKTTVRSPLFEAHPVSGTNIAGNALTLAGGRSNGSGAPGVINLQTAPAGASGSAQNALVTALQVDGDNVPGNFRFLLYDISKGTAVRVSKGAAGSAGTGFSVVRVPD